MGDTPRAPFFHPIHISSTCTHISLSPGSVCNFCPFSIGRQRKFCSILGPLLMVDSMGSLFSHYIRRIERLSHILQLWLKNILFPRELWMQDVCCCPVTTSNAFSSPHNQVGLQLYFSKQVARILGTERSLARSLSYLS